MIDHYYDCFRDVTSKNWDFTQKSDQKAKATQKWWRKTGNVGNWPGLRLTILSHNLGVPGHRGSKELVILTHCTSTWWYIAWCTYSIEVEREEKMREIMSTVEYACMCIVYIYVYIIRRWFPFIPKTVIPRQMNLPTSNDLTILLVKCPYVGFLKWLKSQFWMPPQVSWPNPPLFPLGFGATQQHFLRIAARVSFGQEGIFRTRHDFAGTPRLLGDDWLIYPLVI